MSGLARGGIRATRRALLIRLHCAGPAPCAGRLTVKVGRRALARGQYSLPPSRSRRLKFRLTKAGRRLVAKRRRARRRRPLHARLLFADSGRSDLFRLKRPVHLK